MTHYAGNKKGFTMIEIMVTLVVLAIFSIMAYMTLVGTIRAVTMEGTVLNMDQQANRALQEIAVELRPAVLPVALPSAVTGRSTVSVNGHGISVGLERHTFDLIDSNTNGFGIDNAGNTAKAWRNALWNGVDSIAFLVPVDAQEDGDYLDSVGCLEVGQIASTGRQALACNFTVTTKGFQLDPNQPLSALVFMEPGALNQGNGLNSATVENVGNFDFAASGAILANGGGWPAGAETAFTVIRYIPEPTVPGGNIPVVISEATLGADLDGDGLQDGIFNVGRLQVVYSGGTIPILPPGGGLPVYQTVPQITRDISGPAILRKIAATGESQDPIFRLGAINSSGVFVPGSGYQAIQVRLLMYDFYGQTSRPLTFGPAAPTRALTRWYDTVITLRNMER